MTSKTVSKALSVLNSFTSENPSWGLRELARHLDMNHTVVYRLLSTLEEEGYVFHNPDTQKYELGIKLIELSNVVEEHLKFAELIEPIMKKIALQTGESVVFTILDNEEGVFLKIVESEQQVRFAESVGKRSPLYIGASHKVILAYLPEEIQNRIIDEGLNNNAQQIETKEAFYEVLEKIKHQGWYYTAGETFNDVAAISIPLFDHKKNILGSISVAGPKYRVTIEETERMLISLQENYQSLSSVLRKSFFPSRRKFLMNSLS
ncbi:IclR family transcriptional regulator [Robertmurraya sp. DFI.2.37]|uniref:IclR family transcriptional regulator n=1 Tax=Robertmurraya sp. DFI.2.37 TaxID=3031819 RepID=UPI00124559F5|nr:IclR family transcriptional regulator [Robertmurraya sp. DFI.2.37]MDF1509463.1 IclR family transcriptional regulator [Robertmurraya sp. DFI.2.37]